MADAAYAALSQPVKSLTGRFLIDDTFLAEHGVVDFDGYQYDACMLIFALCKQLGSSHFY